MKQEASVEDLVAAMIRFNEGAAHPPLGRQPLGVPRIGEDCYIFSPSNLRVIKGELVDYLKKCSSPVLLAQSTQRGIIHLTPLSELTGDRRDGMEEGLAKQDNVLERIAQSHDVADTAMVVLEFDDEVVEITFSVLKEWSSRFILNVTWSVSPAEAGSRSRLRLNLVRADGRRTSHFGEAAW